MWAAVTTASARAYQRNLRNCEAHDPAEVRPSMQAPVLPAGLILRVPVGKATA
jgi:hypothetical protein